jgi:hypothetical protein
MFMKEPAARHRKGDSAILCDGHRAEVNGFVGAVRGD